MPLTRTVPKAVPPPEPSKPAGRAGPQPMPETEGRAEVEAVTFMLRDFRTALGENPVGTNAEIMKALTGANAKRARLGPPEGQGLNESGELIDRWGTPYFFHQLSKDNMEVRSAGPDRTLYTSDDIVAQ